MTKLKNNKATPGLIETLRTDWPAIIIIFAGFVAAFFVYPHMPEQVPSHWNLQGEVDDYASRFWGTFGPPLLTVGIYVMMVFLPLIDPRRQNYMKFTRAYQVFKIVLVLFLTGLYVITILYSLGYKVSINRLVPLGVSMLFIVIGNYFGQIRHNYFVGIKTPWTLASEEVWLKTHRFGAKVWVTAGFLGIVGSLISGKWGLIIMLAALAAAIILPTIYSFIIFKRYY
ncbi:SdpI family protein [Desulfolucanica intricata]|uniref:SdpI family protein n=1 Tax=Desulfolucanica intricata TaxID=1285191 RepID=UPI000834F549|nr:SdpI family protein [Desulfolucanica intricata]